jgi:preprotein translocase subunit SecG
MIKKNNNVVVMNILLFIQAVIGCLLIIVILMQRSGADGLSGLQGSPTNSSVISAASVANFLTRTTTILAIAFICNSLLLANKSSSNKSQSIIEDIIKKDQKSEINIKIAE